MRTAMNRFEQLTAQSKHCARLLVTIGENRIELLAVELQEELRRVLRMIMLIFGIAVFGLLAGVALMAALVLVVKVSPATVLLGMTGLYLVAGLFLYWRLTRLLGNWQFLASSIHQLRKDCRCSETSNA